MPKQAAAGNTLRKVHTERYDKQVPYHHIQMGVKFLTFIGKKGEKIRRFQAKFHWHVEDLGIRHAYIKRGTPQLNGKVERSHRFDGQEFYELLSCKGDVNLEIKLYQWEHF